MDFKKENRQAQDCPPKDLTPPMLINEIARLFHAKMKTYDLSGVMTQDSARLLMRELARQDGKSQLDLVCATHLKAPTVSVVLQKMEGEGLVRREADRDDRRTVRVFLTERGKEHNRQVHRRLKELDEQLMKDFSKEESDLLLSFLLRMRNHILPESANFHSQSK